jgi:formamidopyrimidine-DNA glycosylase
MPELPEVETTRRGIEPHLAGRRIAAAIFRRADLRWSIPREVSELHPGKVIDSVERRAKSLLIHTGVGSAMLHLGMSGMLRVLPPDALIGKHDHVDIVLENTTGQRGRVLRFTDPRRFGSLLWQPIGEVHPLRAALGPEPLIDAFDGDTLWHASRQRSAAVKSFLIDNANVTGSPSRIAFSRIESPITVTRQGDRLRH